MVPLFCTTLVEMKVKEKKKEKNNHFQLSGHVGMEILLLTTDVTALYLEFLKPSCFAARNSCDDGTL